MSQGDDNHFIQLSRPPINGWSGPFRLPHPLHNLLSQRPYVSIERHLPLLRYEKSIFCVSIPFSFKFYPPPLITPQFTAFSSNNLACSVVQNVSLPFCSFVVMMAYSTPVLCFIHSAAQQITSHLRRYY
jgi:hypothetical protein